MPTYKDLSDLNLPGDTLPISEGKDAYKRSCDDYAIKVKALEEKVSMLKAQLKMAEKVIQGYRVHRTLVKIEGEQPAQEEIRKV